MFLAHQKTLQSITHRHFIFSALLICIFFGSNTSQAQVCLSGDCQNGNGKWQSSKNDIYEGGFQGGKFRGEGMIIYANKDKYAGDWVNGVKNGVGTYVWKNGDIYEGEWYSDKRYGRGKITFADGRQYQGGWVDDMYEGSGKFDWNDGVYFKGRFKKDVPVSGILRLDRQSSFQGKWEQKRTSATDYYYRFVVGMRTIATWKDGNLTDRRDNDSELEGDKKSSSSAVKNEQGLSFDGHNNLPNDGKAFSKKSSANNASKNANKPSNEEGTINEDGNIISDSASGDSTDSAENSAILAEEENKQASPPPLPAPQDPNDKKSLTERYGESFNYLVYQLESDKNILFKKQKRVQEEIGNITGALKNEDLSPEDKKELEGFLHKLKTTLLNTSSELQEVTTRSAEIIEEMRSTILEQTSTIKSIKEDQEKKRNQLILTGSLLFLSFVSLAVMLNLYRNLKKKNSRIAQQNREIAQQNTVIETSRNELAKQNKNVISSINYASRMQTAMLPSHDILTEVFSEGFVLLMPCKIVSGDFYWIARRENYTFVAAIDCTGHGVPGAFMSLIGNDILNDLVLRQGLTAPQEILQKLHEGVVSHMTRGNKESRDGMDLGLCVIDHHTQQLHFAGAINPLLLVKAGEIVEIRGTRKPIGGQQLERRSEKPFEGHTIQLEGDESCYLLSDGYRDQFGGPNNKKLMKKGFIKMLKACKHLSMNEQEEYMRNFFNDWKGERDQLDDVLVIGFKPLGKKAVMRTKNKSKVA